MTRSINGNEMKAKRLWLKKILLAAFPRRVLRPVILFKTQGCNCGLLCNFGGKALWFIWKHKCGNLWSDLMRHRRLFTRLSSISVNGSRARAGHMRAGKGRNECLKVSRREGEESLAQLAIKRSPRSQTLLDIWHHLPRVTSTRYRAPSVQLEDSL